MSEYRPKSPQKRTVLHMALPLDTPFSMGVFMGESCNFRCIYCEHSPLNKEKPRWVKGISKEVFEEIIDQAKEFPHKIKTFVNFGSGEHLLDKTLADKYAYVADAQIAEIIQLTTNASLLTHERTKELIDAGVNKMVCSLQGVSKETYKRVCGVDIDMDALYDNLAFLYSYSRGKCHVHIKTLDTALDYTKGEDALFIKMYENICDTIYIDSVIPIFKNVDYAEIIQQDSPAVDASRLGGKTIFQGLVDPNDIHCCRAVFHDLFVWEDGEIAPCCNCERGFGIGNIHEDGLIGAWHGKKRMELIRKNLMLEMKDVSFCRNCMIPNYNTHVEDQIDPYREDLLERFGFQEAR